MIRRVRDVARPDRRADARRTAEDSTMRYALTIIALALLSLAGGPAAAQDKPIELKFASWVGIVHGHHTQVLVPWSKMIEEKSGGRLKVTIYPGSTLGKPADHFDLVKDGVADMGFVSPGYTAGRFPLVSVAELPLLFKTGKGASQATWSLSDKYFKPEFTGIKLLWIWVHPPGQFHLAKKQVKVLEDLAGLKIRAGTPMLANMVKTLGATPVSIAAPETYTALERGVVDGTVFPWEAIASFKLAEVLRHHTVVNLYASPLVTVMNQKKYDSLPPDLRKVIDDLSGGWGAEYTGAAWDRNEKDGIDAAKKVGATIYVVPAEERQRWAVKLKPVEDEWVKSMEAKGLPGRQLLGDLREAIKRYDP
jgi:TRAP-type C4-dicarboxylate transport system substrate-binding protein